MSTQKYRHLEEENSEENFVSDSWGGSWTKEKLDTFEEYVRNVYLKIMNHQRDKYNWKLIYLDAFAGSGSQSKGKTLEIKDALVSIFPKELLPDEETDVYQGAAERVVKIEESGTRGFDYYYFVDKDKDSLDKLEEKLSIYNPNGRKIYKNEDANTAITEMANAMSMNYHFKSLTLLDPFGMQIDWKTIECLQGLSVDLFILIPTGVIINRLLGKDGEIMYPDKLSRCLGMSVDEIKSKFYKSHKENNLFGESFDVIDKVKNPCKKIAEEYINKLNSAFKYVTKKPLVLTNSRNVPIYHFVFASQNENAVKLAQYIINKQKRHGIKN